MEDDARADRRDLDERRVMRRLVAVSLAIALSSLAGCARVAVGGGSSGAATSIGDTTDIRVYHDDERLVTCWVYHLNTGAGIDCLRDEDLAP